jgi:hypothetical protein
MIDAARCQAKYLAVSHMLCRSMLLRGSELGVDGLPAGIQAAVAAPNH